MTPYEHEFLQPGSRYSRLFLLLAWLIPMAWMGVIRLEGMPDGETANDAYYHIAMAERGPAVFCARKFPALDLSVWRDSFADKELLYHFLLCGLVRVQKFFTGAVQAPFHFPAMVFVGLLLASLLFAMKRMGVSPPLFLPMTLLAVMPASSVLFRMLMLRPHILSLILMLLLCGLLAGGTHRSRLGWTLLISFVYAWSYSNPQFILIPVCCFAGAWFPRDGWKSLLLAAAGILGILLGLLIHPQFPNTFIIWKVQSFDALFGPLLSPGTRSFGSLMPPLEMMSPGVLWIRNALPMFIFAYLNFLIFARLAVRSGWKKIPPAVYAVGVMALLFSAGTFLVLRTIEYAGPFNGLFGALVWSMALREQIFLPGRERPVRFCLWLSLLAFLPCLLAAAINVSYSKVMTPPALKIGKWMERNLPEKELVVNLNWGDFPSLFHGNRRQVFLWGMDPEFSIAADPKRTRRIERVLLEQKILVPRRFAMATGARYAVVLAKREKYVKFLKELGWRTVYEADDGAVFYVE